jgi:hypothetical protein
LHQLASLKGRKMVNLLLGSSADLCNISRNT